MTKTQRNSNVTFFIAAITISVIAAILLSIESYLALQGSSLCKTTACSIVANYLKIQEGHLVAGGAAFFWLLSLVFYFSYRYSKLTQIVPLIVLTTALAFDGSLLGYQVFTIGKYCLLCHLVAYTILITAFLWSLSLRNFKISACLLCCWLGGFSSQAVIQVPLPSDTGQKMILLETGNPATAKIKEQPTVTLFFSMHCPHCMELISSIESMDMAPFNWKFANIDQDEESLQKLAIFVEQAKIEENVFSLLLSLKNSAPHSSNRKKTLKHIREKNKHTLSFLANLGIRGIPVVFIEKTDRSKLIVQGKKQSLTHLALLSKN